MADLGINLKGQDNLSKTVKEAKQSIDELINSTTDLGKAAKEFDKITNAGKPLKTQLRQLKALMADMQFKGLNDTAAYTQIAQYAGSIADSMGDAQQAVKAFSSDTANLDAMASAFQGLTGAITVGTSAMALFGVENDEVEQAILKVQSAMALLNGVTAIANTLNKDSALMLKLKSINLIGNTTASTANTVAETVNTTATGANTVAKGVNTAATGALTTAINTATAAQIKNNLAVLKNPYVIAAAAVAGLVAGIGYWISTMDDATSSELALNTAVDALNSPLETEMKKVGEQLSLYEKLKSQYDQSGQKVDAFAKKLINNTEVQKRLGVVVKTVDDVHRLFADNSNKAYTRAAIARAKALATEQARAALLGMTLAKLSQVYSKFMSGQEVNWEDMRQIIEAMGYSVEQANKLMTSSGFEMEYERFGKNNIRQGTGDLNKLIEQTLQGGTFKVLDELAESFKGVFDDINEIDFKGILTSNFDALDSGIDKSTNKVKKTKETVKKGLKDSHDKIKEILTTLEGCDAIIQRAENDMKKLDRTSEGYADSVKRLKQVIQGAKAAKLLLIDNSTMKGLQETRRLIEEIIQDLKPGTKEYDEWKEKLKQCDEQAYEMAKTLSVNGDMKSLKEVQAALSVLIETLPEGSEILEKYAELWNIITNRINTASRNIENIKKGIEKGSIAELRQQIADIDEELNNKNLKLDARINLSYKKRALQMRLNEITRGGLSIDIVPEVDFIEKGSLDDLEKSADNAKTIIQQLHKQFDDGIINKEEFLAEVNFINGELLKLGLKPIQVHIEADWEKFVANAEDAMSRVQTIVSAVDSIQSLTDALHDGANAWDIFKSAITTVQSVMQAYATVMETITAIQEAHELATLKQTVQMQVQGGAAVEASGAEQLKTTADAETVTSATAATIALKEQESAYLDMAAASIFAAHSTIPFAGVGIASGLITTMMGAMAAQHAASKSLAAFADGGIVGGGSLYGDRLLVRVNTGEMILNGKQQKRLFNLLDKGGAIGGQMGEISFKLKGSDIYGSMKNYTAVKSKTSTIKGF